METIQSIITKLGFKSVEEAASHHARLILLGKISKYEAEYNFFKKKYNCEFKEFEQKINSMVNEEDFEMEDDLMDWQFAYELLTKYRQQEKILSYA